MTDKPKRAVIWRAVSSLDQAEDDKVSLSYQETRCRELCEIKGYTVVDVLSVDGYSRSEADLLTALDELRAQGVTAYDRIREHWKQHTIDVLVVFTDSRLGRSPSLYTHVFDNLLSNHIEIDAVQGGLITYRDRRMRNALGIIAVTADMDRLKDQFDPGMDKRVALGKPVASKNTFTHRIVRDERGKSYTYAVREENREAATLMAEAIIDRKPYTEVAILLGYTYGVKNERGKPIWYSDIHAILHSAVSWGHIARKHYGQRGIWVFDDSAPLPAGVVINRNTHEPMWTGDLATDLQAELRRRATVMKGRASPQRLSIFSGLIYCGLCGGMMNYQHPHDRPNWRGYLCKTNYLNANRPNLPTCPVSKKSIHVNLIQDFLSPILERAFASQSLDFVLSTAESQTQAFEIERLRKSIDDRRAYARKLMADKTTTPAVLLPDLQTMLDAVGVQIDTLQQNLDRLERRNHVHAASEAARLRALREHAGVSMTAFWSYPDDKINQLLFMLLGNHRVIVENGEVTRLAVIDS